MCTRADFRTDNETFFTAINTTPRNMTKAFAETSPV